MTYPKSALSLDDQVGHLKIKGLTIPDENRAKRYLSNISLFRLKAYVPPFYETGTKAFSLGSSFDDILALYIFDRKVRVLALDALERIEIAVRSTISNLLSEKKGPHWFLDKNNFSRDFNAAQKGCKSGHDKLIEQMGFCTGKRGGGKHPACDHYFRTYPEPQYPALPPSWIIAEVMTMGTWSKIYENLRKTKYKKMIAKSFGFTHGDLERWLHALTLIRNICAHHQRLWNRSLPHKASNVELYTHSKIPLGKAYQNFAMIYAFLCSFTHDSKWNEHFFNLVDSCPVDMYHLSGFPPGWYEEPFWRLS